MRSFIGFCIGVSIPASLGAYELYQLKIYAASLPPGEFVCGNPTLGAFVLIVFGAPLLGLIGAVVAGKRSRIRNQ